MIKFYIIYSIDIPLYESEYWEYSIEELIKLFNDEKLELPFDYIEFHDEDYDNCTTNDIFEEYYGDYKEEMIEILEDHYRSANCTNLLKNNLPYYIKDNPELFSCTESDNFSQEYQYAKMNTCHRKYTALLTEEQFIEFAKMFEYSSTCNTLGALTEYGHLQAFSIEVGGDNIEYVYVSLLFDEEIEESKMMKIEDNIRECIENGDVNEKMFEINERNI